MPDLISIVIPTYNRKEWTLLAIESALSQTYKNIEVIVVDDGSSDGTYETIKSRYSDKVILPPSSQKPTGSGAARNRGAAIAKGRFLSFLDSDDLWEANKLELQLATFKQSRLENLAFIGGGCKYIDIDGNPTDSPDYPPKSATYTDFAIRIKMPGSGSNNLILKSAFDEIGGFDESLLRAQDKDLWLRLLERYSVDYTHEITAIIRLHDTPRVDINLDVIRDSRLKIDKKIRPRSLKQKAIAHTYFVLAKRSPPQQKLRAILYMLQSFLNYPLIIENDVKRARYFLKMILNRV